MFNGIGIRLGRSQKTGQIVVTPTTIFTRVDDVADNRITSTYSTGDNQIMVSNDNFSMVSNDGFVMVSTGSVTNLGDTRVTARTT